MLVQRARSEYRKKWAAKHEYEELKKRSMAGTRASCLRNKVKENWTEKHRSVARRIFLEGGWTQKRPSDIGWSDVGQCQACQLEDGTERHRLYHCPEWHEIRREISDAFRKWEQKARTSKKEWKWQRVIVAHPLSESWNGGHFSRKSWESEKHQSWSMQWPLTAPCWVLLGNGEHVVGQWCSWIVMKRWGLCMGCMARWRQIMSLSAPSRGQS